LAAGQWEPATEVDWSATVALPAEIEDAVVQVMTYLVENEHTALMISARMLANLNPHYRAVMQLLANQVADESWHVAFGVAHTAHLVRADPPFLSRLRGALHTRNFI
jgi:hypothetical protein